MNNPQYDTKITTNFKSVEYAQYVKYSRYKIVVEGGNPTREFRSDEVLGMLPKDAPKTFTVYLNSKNPEDYFVDIEMIKRRIRRNQIFWIIVVPWSVALIGWIASLFLHTK